MLMSDKIAIAAHLHVLLRRLTGRVSDTEWMASNQEYAVEIIRVAREAALERSNQELALWAEKLERAVLGEFKSPTARPPMPVDLKQALANAKTDENGTESGLLNSLFGGKTEPTVVKDGAEADTRNVTRYIGGLR